MIFENPSIDTASLPKVGQVEFNQLAPAYKTSEYIGTAILFSFLFIGALAAYFTVPPEFGYLRYGAVFLWGFFFAISMFLVGKRYSLTGYAVREHDVVYKYGVYWQGVMAIPFNRIQHCEISQGPIQNALGLASLRIFTAGGTGSDLSIDGLHHEEAKRIKEFVTSRISGQAPVNIGQPTSPEHSTDNWQTSTDNPQQINDDAF